MAAIHTVPEGDRWANRVEEGEIFSRHDTKEQAVDAGRERARRDQVEHVIHRQDGSIGERNSYGNDPASRPG
jgi:hypothetical protein